MATSAQRPPPQPPAPAAQVLHARTCTRTERQLITFVGACHLAYSYGFDNLTAALEVLPAMQQGR